MPPNYSGARDPAKNPNYLTSQAYRDTQPKPAPAPAGPRIGVIRPGDFPPGTTTIITNPGAGTQTSETDQHIVTGVVQTRMRGNGMDNAPQVPVDAPPASTVTYSYGGGGSVDGGMGFTGEPSSDSGSIFTSPVFLIAIGALIFLVMKK